MDEDLQRLPADHGLIALGCLFEVESLELTADAGLPLNAYTAEPGAAFQDALNLLASWMATDDQPEQTPARENDGV